MAYREKKRFADHIVSHMMQHGGFIKSYGLKEKGTAIKYYDLVAHFFKKGRADPSLAFANLLLFVAFFYLSNAKVRSLPMIFEINSTMNSALDSMYSSSHSCGTSLPSPTLPPRLPYALYCWHFKFHS